MASIHQQSNGTWHISFRFGGTQFKPSLKTTSQRKAKTQKTIIEETLGLLDRGRITPPENATRAEIIQFVLSGGKQTTKPAVTGTKSFKIVVEQYFAAYTVGKEDATIAGERIHTKHLLRLIGGQTSFSSINADTLQKYAAKRRKEKGQRGRKLSTETVKKEFRTFAQVWGMARVKGYVAGQSPTKDVKLDLPDEKPPFRTWKEIEAIIKRGNLDEHEQKEYWDCLFLDEQQVLDLLEHVHGATEHEFIYAAVAFASFTGCRRAEVARSQIEDWDFDQGVVRIRERKGSRKKRTTFREVNIHPKLRKIMQRWFKIHPGGGFTIVVPPNLPRSRIMRDQPSPLTPSQAQDYFRRAVAGSKWKVLRGWHILRHSFCSNCARQGVPDAVIDAWMGHRGDEGVKQRYRHLFPTDKKVFMKKLFQASPVAGRGSGS